MVWYATMYYHSIENTLANKIKATYARRTMGRFDARRIHNDFAAFCRTLVGCIFYGMAWECMFKLPYNSTIGISHICQFFLDVFVREYGLL